jgi:ribose 1,5-bisphosphokinase PhnN
MLLIIEGPDGSGKTTLVEELRMLARDAQQDFVTLHKGQPDPGVDLFEEYHRGLDFYRDVEPKKTFVVADRWHLGELVYGPVMRDVSRVSIEQARMIDRRVDYLGGVRIVLDAVDSTLWHRAQARGEDFVTDPKDFFAIVARYREVRSWLHGWTSIATDNGRPEICRFVYDMAVAGA